MADIDDFLLSPTDYLSKNATALGGYSGGAMRHLVVNTAPQTFAKAIAFTPTNTSFVRISLAKSSGAGLSGLNQLTMASAPGDNGVRYLPWEMDRVTYMQLDANATWFFTGPLQGCHILIGQDGGGSYWAFHANANASNHNSAYNAQIKDAMVQTAGGLYVPGFNVTNALRASDYAEKNKPYNAFVFGRRPVGRDWNFYVHCVVLSSGNAKIKLGAVQF